MMSKPYKNKTIQSLCMKEWSEEDKPVNKMRRNGTSSMSMAELMAIIMGCNDKTLNSCRTILKRCDEQNYPFTQIDRTILKEYAFTPVQMDRFMAAQEFGRRRDNSTKRTSITKSQDVYDAIYPDLVDKKVEEMWVLYMNVRHNILEKRRVASGGVAQTVVDIKVVMAGAISLLASSIAIVHNHPTGCTEPSSDDDRVTQKIKQACQCMDIQLTDHLVFTDNGYYSYADEGKI